MYIVVEGKSDTAKIKNLFPNCYVIETNGSEISQETINLIKTISEKEKVIVLTDPDGPGEKIRQKIISKVPNLFHAYVRKEKSIKKNKVGVAEALDEEIIKAIGGAKSFEIKSTLSWNDYIGLGFQGNKALRVKVSNNLGITSHNNKTLFNRLNMLGINKKELEKIIYD